MATELWTIDPHTVDDPASLSWFRSLMSEEEEKRRARFRFAKDRHQYVVSHALVRCALSHHDGQTPPDGWRFEKNEYGRPEIAGDNPLDMRFNLSHTDGLIACAIAYGRDIGVDVEATDRRGRTVELADRYFAEGEIDALHTLNREQQRDRFFDLWTLKEAYIKACGKGLAIPLSQFSFELDEVGEPVKIAFGPEIDDDPEDWIFVQLEPTERHKIAVALRKNGSDDVKVRVRRWVVPSPD